MKERYGYTAKGKLTRVAKIYTKKEHPVEKKHMDAHALHIVRRLEEYGYEAYIVGGALRDILLDTPPKDFDIATNAHPQKIKRLFDRRARVIGKRFRIVLITTEGGKYIEVTTFRSTKNPADPYSKEIFGTMDQDVLRRDFTCNALYYSPTREEIVDYKNGVGDIKKRLLVPIHKEFQEDPVRMLRALKFAAKCELKIPLGLRLDIRRNASLITQVSRSRMTEEIMKALLCGASAPIFDLCRKHNVLEYMLPRVSTWITDKHADAGGARLGRWTAMRTQLELCDSAVAEENTISRARVISYFTCAFTVDFITAYTSVHGKIPSFTRLMEETKAWLHPITPASMDIHKGLEMTIKESNTPMRGERITRERTRRRRHTRSRRGDSNRGKTDNRARRQ